MIKLRETEKVFKYFTHALFMTQEIFDRVELISEWVGEFENFLQLLDKYVDKVLRNEKQINDDIILHLVIIIEHLERIILHKINSITMLIIVPSEKSFDIAHSVCDIVNKFSTLLLRLNLTLRKLLKVNSENIQKLKDKLNSIILTVSSFEFKSIMEFEIKYMKDIGKELEIELLEKS